MFDKLYDPLKRANKSIIATQDGSATMYSSEFRECYHSTKDGALNESIKKHIEPGFNFK